MNRVEDRARFRTPVGLAIIAYKSMLGVGELLVGILLLIPSLDVSALFHRLVAEELREDPSDLLVSLFSRHLPSIIQHRPVVGLGLIAFGVGKLVAAGAMWNGKEWGRYLLAGLVVLLVPFDVRTMVTDPSVAHFLLVFLNVLVVYLLARPTFRTRSQTDR
ncbi:MAG: putative rane protein [Actinomycetota bacterium]|nr:putative rane protein [Actinomycetota bacterium]